MRSPLVPTSVVSILSLITSPTSAAADPVTFARPDYPAANWVAAAEANFTDGRNGSEPSTIAIHTFDPGENAEPDYENTIQFYANPNAGQTSAHYLIRSSDGAVTQMVENSDTAHHVAGHNNYTIGIEHQANNPGPNPDRWFTDIMMRSSGALVRDLCERYLIPRTSHNVGGIDVNRGVKGHSQFSGVHLSNSDPGAGWYRRMDSYMQKVRGGKRSAVVRFGSQLQVFQRHDDLSIRQRVWDGFGWRGWFDMGGTFAGEPSAVAFGRQLHVFAIDKASDELRSRFWDPTLGWSDWAEPGVSPSPLRGSPSAVVIDDRIHVFARGVDNRVYEARWSDGAWRWTDLGGTVVSDPEGLNFGGQAQVYVLGPDQRLRSSVLSGSTWRAWSKTGEPGARLTGTPSAVQFGDQAQVFVQGLNGNVHQAVWSSETGWVWHNLGGAVFGDPSATVLGSQMHVFALGVDSQLWGNSWSPNGWTAWHQAGTAPHTLTGSPTAVTFGSQLQVVAQGLGNGHAEQAVWQSGRPWQWSDLGGTAAD